MKYEIFKDYIVGVDPNHPFLVHVVVDKDSDFYFEPMVYTQLMGFKERHEDKFQLIVDEMIDRVKKNKHILFVGDYESYFEDIDGYIVLEVIDITNHLKIFVEDKSRGSDYGD